MEEEGSEQEKEQARNKEVEVEDKDEGTEEAENTKRGGTGPTTLTMKEKQLGRQALGSSQTKSGGKAQAPATPRQSWQSLVLKQPAQLLPWPQKTPLD